MRHFVTLLILAITLGAWLFGRDALVHGVLAWVSEGYTVRSIDGSLLGELHLTGLEVHLSGGGELRVESLALDPDWRSIATGRPALESLTVDGLQAVLPGSAGRRAGKPRALPLAIERLHMDRVEVQSGGKPIALDRISGAIELDTDRIDFSRFEVRGHGLRLDLDGHLALASSQSALQAHLVHAGTGLDIEASISGALPSPSGALRVAGPVTGVATFEATLGSEPRVRILQGRIDAVDAFSLTGLALTIDQRGNALAMEGQARLAYSGLPDTQLVADAELRALDRLTGSLTAINGPDRLEAGFTGSVVEQRLTAKVALSLADLWRWPAALELAEKANAPLPLDASFTIRGRNPLDPQIEIAGGNGQFVWREVPGSIDFDARIATGLWTGQMRIDWAGRQTQIHIQPGRLDADIALADAALVWPSAKGSLEGRVELSLAASGMPLDARAELAGNALALGSITAERAEATFEWGVRQDIDVEFDAEALRIWAGQAPVRLTASANGTISALRWQVTAQSADGSALASGSANLSEPRIVNVGMAEIDVPGVDRIALREPFEIVMDPSGMPRARGCLAGQHGSLACFGVDPEGWRLSATKLGDDLWMPLLVEAVPNWPRGAALHGTLDILGTYQRGLASVSLRGQDLEAVMDADLSEPHSVRLSKLTGEATWRFASGSGFVALHVSAPEAGDLDAELSVDNGSLAGEISIELHDLAPFAAFEPALAQARGQANGRVTIAGTPSAPRFDVTFSANGEARIAPANVMLRQITLTISGTSTSGIQIDGSVQSGEGEITVTGTIRQGAAASLHLTGHDFLLVDQPDLLAAVSPDATIDYAPGSALRVRGSLLIDRSGVVLSPALPDQRLLSDDVVIIGSDGGATRPPPIEADLSIDLGPRTELVAGPLDTRLSGTLRLTLNPERPSRLIGSVKIAEGAYQLYGVPLEIERGRMDFTGPINNPAVQLRAVRHLDDARQVGIEVSGTLSRLRTRVFSEPPLTDTDALAMLITGRSFAEVSRNNSSELDRIGNAAAALGLGATGIITRIREGMRLDELQVASPLDREAGAILVGKQLTDRLYARYAYSLFNRTGGLVLRYRIRKNLSLQSELGVSRGVDITYHREFD